MHSSYLKKKHICNFVSYISKEKSVNEKSHINEEINVSSVVSIWCWIFLPADFDKMQKIKCHLFSEEQKINKQTKNQ